MHTASVSLILTNRWFVLCYMKCSYKMKCSDVFKRIDFCLYFTPVTLVGSCVAVLSTRWG